MRFVPILIDFLTNIWYNYINIKGGILLLSIAIYSDLIADTASLKTLIQDYLIEYKTIAKISIFKKGEDVIMIRNKYDVYFIDMDTDEDCVILGE